MPELVVDPVLDGEKPVCVLEGGGDLGPAFVVVLENRDVDDLEVLAVSGPRPNPFPQLHPPPAGCGEAGIGDVFEAAVAVGFMIVFANEGETDGVEKIGRNPGIVEYPVDEVEEGMALVHGVGSDLAVPVPGNIAGEAAPPLAIVKDHDFAPEAVRMSEDSVDQAADDVAVRAASALPLGVDLDQDHVVGGDESHRPGRRSLSRSAIKRDPPPFHKGQKRVHAKMASAVVAERRIGDSVNVKNQGESALRAGGWKPVHAPSG